MSATTSERTLILQAKLVELDILLNQSRNLASCFQAYFQFLKQIFTMRLGKCWQSQLCIHRYLLLLLSGTHVLNMKKRKAMEDKEGKSREQHLDTAYCLGLLSLFRSVCCFWVARLEGSPSLAPSPPWVNWWAAPATVCQQGLAGICCGGPAPVNGICQPTFHSVKK